MEPIKLIPLHSGRAEVWSNGAENLSVHLTYDISNYLKSWPDAQPSVAFERADGEKYPHAWELDGPVLHIPLLLADTETPGMCKCMITMLSGDGRANTMVFYGSVTEGIDSLGEAPTDPELGIIEQVNLAAADANAAKVGAENAQNAAEEAQKNAQDAAIDAENSKNAAKISEENAQQYAQQASEQNTAAAREASNAAASAKAAAASEGNAATSSAAAASYASNASQNAVYAAQSRDSANTSATNASTSAANAENSAKAAQEALDNMEERYYVPNVDTDGNLSFTPTSSEMTAVDTVNIRGPQGIQGPVGDTGPAGPVGATGEMGVAGADGVSPIIAITDIAGGHRLTITDKDGTKTVDVLNGTQADWNENDETSPAYVKGRTHWVEKDTAVFFSETSFTADTLTDGAWLLTSPLSNKPAAGTECTVTWNGTEYKCPVQEVVEESITITVIGNGEDVGLTGNGEPFRVMLVPDDVAAEMGAYGVILPLDGSTSATVTMAGGTEIVHPLDLKYIGDLRGQKQITITIAEDGTVTSDTEFAAAWAMDPGELQTGILIHESSKYKGDTYATPADVCKNEGPFGTSIILRVNNPAKDTSDSTDSDDVRIIRWQSSGVIGISSWIQKGLPYMSSGADWTGRYLQYNGIAWFPRETTEMKTDLGLSALNTANAGKGLKVADDGTMAAEKYQQPEWGSETAIVELLPETELSIMSEDEPMAIVQQKVTLIGGAVYTVNYNGTEYECTAYEGGEGGIVMLGNAAAVDGEDTGEPFFLAFYDDTIAAEIGYYEAVVPLDGSTMFTLSIKGVVETIHAIPVKYLQNSTVMCVNLADNSTADKTYDEIKEAVNAGMHVYVKNKSIVDEAEATFIGLFVSITNQGEICFLFPAFNGQTIACNPDNTWGAL